MKGNGDGMTSARMPPYRLIATDVDGTLLDERSAVTPRVRAAIAALQRPSIGIELADEWHVDRLDERLQDDIEAGRVAVAPTVSDLERVIVTTIRGVSKMVRSSTISTSR